MSFRRLPVQPTRDEFWRYKNTQNSGEFNMIIDQRRAAMRALLPIKTYRDIQCQFESLDKEYPYITACGECHHSEWLAVLKSSTNSSKDVKIICGFCLELSGYRNENKLPDEKLSVFSSCKHSWISKVKEIWYCPKCTLTARLESSVLDAKSSYQE
jgi:superfamily II helicase